ncbi:BrnA antitoxin family protein [Roseixanthobacter liquoris]|uniref:BrnA antitoxin family protein n=1 Tax=Roseixanthobacter liquoris TaxID=3119921 RepID=UPI00372CDDC4
MRYTPEEVAKLPVEVDWDRINAMTDDEIEAAARSDSDWEGLLDIDWSKAEMVIPVKKMAISIRLDEDVLAFFKAGGEGYQRRINAVLKSYVNQAKAAGRRRSATSKKVTPAG